MYINGLKYACSTCIKGHRSSHCSHVDRPLFEIRKKGRPVTQCTFCRDLRKAKQVHIKCACSNGNDKKVGSTTATSTVNVIATTTSAAADATNTTAASSSIGTIDNQQQQQGRMMYRTDSPSQQAQQGGCGNDGCQDNSKKSLGQHCTCPSPNSTAPSATSGNNNPVPMIRSLSSSSSTTGGNHHNNNNYFQQHTNVTQDSTNQMDVTHESGSSLLAPLCPTPSPPAQLVNDENLSYSWALITSPSVNQIDLLSTTSQQVLNTSDLFTDMMMDGEENGSNADSGSNNYQHLGFIFHKPTSTQRFLDGQPRVRRRKSTNQKRTIAANSTSVTPTNYAANNGSRLPMNALVDKNVLSIDTISTDYSLSTPPSSAVSPHHMSSSSASSSVAVGGNHHHPEPMDMQFDYLAEQLEILSSGSNQSNNGFIGDLTNAEELTAILNNVLQKDDDESSLPSAASSTYGGAMTDPMPNNNSMNGGAASGIHSPTNSDLLSPSQSGNNSNGTTTTKKKSNSLVPNALNRSHCGSFVPRSKCCKPVGSVGGESVVITITPLTSTNASSSNNNNSMMNLMLEDDQQQKTTTRIVTCYCGNTCTCPGCLVHPGNLFLGSDPYAGLMMNPSSSTSSSCYGSDEEDISSSYSKSNNNNSFISF